MEDTKLGNLINELKALKIKESEIKVRESQIISEIELINERKQRQVTTKTTSHQLQTPLSVNGFKQGDRVVIKNKVIKPATRIDATWTKEKEQVATVTRVTENQVHFITDNGTRTWRAPNNLSKLAVNKFNDECHS